MGERVTKKDVQLTFGALCVVASRVGFEISTWMLEYGKSTYKRPYRLFTVTRDADDAVRSLGDHPLGDAIGMTATEAHAWLCAALKTLQAVERLQQENYRAHAASENLLSGTLPSVRALQQSTVKILDDSSLAQPHE